MSVLLIQMVFAVSVCEFTGTTFISNVTVVDQYVAI